MGASLFVDLELFVDLTLFRLLLRCLFSLNDSERDLDGREDEERVLEIVALFVLDGRGDGDRLLRRDCLELTSEPDLRRVDAAAADEEDGRDLSLLTAAFLCLPRESFLLLASFTLFECSSRETQYAPSGSLRRLLLNELECFLSFKSILGSCRAEGFCTCLLDVLATRRLGLRRVFP